MIDDDKNCPLCISRVKDRIIEETGTVVAIRDGYPVTRWHTLIIPRRHTPDFFTMTSREKRDTEAMILLMKEKILNEDSSVTGFNIGINCGVSAGQTIMHAHVHLIPRRDGDICSPKGGVRGVIPEKMAY